MALPVNKRVLKILFILFVVAFCVYLVPRVAINFFYYPDDKIYGPDPGRRNPSNLRLRTVLVCKAGLFLLRRALLTTPSQPSFMLTAMPEICPPTGRWSVGYPSVISTFLCLIIAGLVNQRHAVPGRIAGRYAKCHQCGAPSQRCKPTTAGAVRAEYWRGEYSGCYWSG